jgi:hypothetical protein
MKITYSLGLEDFRALRPPFTLRVGRNAGFKGAMAICGFFVVMGVWGIFSDMQLPIGGSLVGMGVFFALGAYYFEKQSVGKSKEKYERDLAAAYQQAHCSEQRTLEVDENNFTVSSGSGSIARPWSELMQFSENEKLFLVGSRTESQIIPKSAFDTAGKVTEFRTFILDKLNHGRPITSRPVEFRYQSRDFRSAYFLHLAKGGGSRALLKTVGSFAVMTYAACAIWYAISPRKEFLPLFALLCAFVGIPLYRVARMKRKKYRGMLKIYFSDEGLYLQDATAQARNTWSHFVGYLEGHETFLLYVNPRLYRIIPKRVLGSGEASFRDLLKKKLPPFNYRIPTPVSSAGVAAGSGQRS